MATRDDSPVGCRGRVTSAGAIRPGRVGEVMVSVGGGVQAYLARDADGSAIAPGVEIVVVDYEPPRTVVVTRLYDTERPTTEEHTHG
jgi:hypothetical protein